MDTYLIGNLLGRLVISYIITWFIFFAFSGFKWRNAFTYSRKWYGLVVLMFIFLAGLGVFSPASGRCWSKHSLEFPIGSNPRALVVVVSIANRKALCAGVEFYPGWGLRAGE
ncbi:MAG: hypothetical protein MI866_17370, partial [Bacteroidales bacterium]|nr:hypothetical protein [Bacteroidales bacterium]